MQLTLNSPQIQSNLNQNLTNLEIDELSSKYI